LTDAYAQSETMQPLPVAAVERAPVPAAPVETPVRQAEPDPSLTELAPAQSEAMPPAVESLPELMTAVETPMPVTELAPVQSEAVQPAALAQVEAIPDLIAPVQPAPVPEIQSAPVPPAPSAASIGQPASQAKASSPIPVDWREKYYRTLALKRAGAILLDQVIIIFVPLILLFMVAPGISDSGANWFLVFLYFVVAPLMESSKWQGTIGKRILKLQITDKEGDRITFLRAFWRNIVRSLVLYSYIFVIPLVIQYFRFNKTRKLFQDELSGTVIGERLTGSAPVKVAVTSAGANTGA
jgi:uncharacterized RDD family membrane protein YckC